MTPRWPPLPRRLPRTPAPLRHETYESYLARLAAANSLSFDDLDEIAHLYDDDLDGLDQLAALTGYLATVLRHAIPELFHHQAAGTTALDGTSPTPREFINDIRPPCRRCAASAGADPGTARVWAAHDACVCVRHQLWIGEGNDQPSHQLDLGSHPDIVHAQIRHQRIVRSRGRPAARDAFNAARGLWLTMSTTPGYSSQREARTARVRAQASAEEAVSNAVTYPETVAFTAILASPHWRAIVLSRKPADNQRFHHEFRRRVATGHQENGYPRSLFVLDPPRPRTRPRRHRRHRAIPPAYPAPPGPLATASRPATSPGRLAEMPHDQRDKPHAQSSAQSEARR